MEGKTTVDAEKVVTVIKVIFTPFSITKLGLHNSLLIKVRKVRSEIWIRNNLFHNSKYRNGSFISDYVTRSDHKMSTKFNKLNLTGVKCSKINSFLGYSNKYFYSIWREEKHKVIDLKILECLDRNYWPFKDKSLKNEINKAVKELQTKIATEVRDKNQYDDSFMKKINMLVKSRFFIVHAIKEVWTNTGSKTPGSDNIIMSEEVAIQLAKEINYKFLKLYKAESIRRVYIPKSNNKMRPFGIPTIKDRVIQELFRSLLDPIIEVTSDPNSYGFRKGRNCHMAIGALSQALRTCSSTINGEVIIIDLDIKGFFDNISKQWILNNFPFPSEYKHVLEEWLNSGIIYKNSDIEYTQSGVPQGGIISPLIANFTLNGIEEAAFKNCKKTRPSTEEERNIQKGSWKYKEIYYKLIRYADDFIIITNDNKYVEQIKTNVYKFLEERGLEINWEKSKIYNFKEPNVHFNYLGFTFHKVNKVKLSSILNRRDMTDNLKVMIYPEKLKVMEFRTKIKNIIKSSYNLSAYELIKQINPIIRGWSAYFDLGLSAKILSRIDNYIYRRIWVWLKRKYPKTSKYYLGKKFFGVDKIKEGLILPTKKFKEMIESMIVDKSPVDRKWHFRGCVTHNNNKRTENTKSNVVFLVITILERKRVPTNMLALPDNLRKKNPYINETEFNNVKMKQILLRIRKDTIKDQLKLYQKQNGICEYCGEFINDIDKAVIHHIIPLQSVKESKEIKKLHSGLNNKSLIHKECHIDLHNIYGYKKIGLLKFRAK